MVDFNKMLKRSKLEKEYSFIKSNFRISNQRIDYILEEIRNLHKICPFYYQKMKNGSTFNIKTTSFGKYGWVSDENGYSYKPNHPNGKRWNNIPEGFYKIIAEVFEYHGLNRNELEYDSCLVNFYDENSKLGMHFDNTEKDLQFPIFSISIGCDALFKIEFGEESFNYIVGSGEYIIMEGKSRNCKHGVEKLLIKDNQLSMEEEINYNPLKNKNTRLNLTFRKSGY